MKRLMLYSYGCRPTNRLVSETVGYLTEIAGITWYSMTVGDATTNKDHYFRAARLSESATQQVGNLDQVQVELKRYVEHPTTLGYTLRGGVGASPYADNLNVIPGSIDRVLIEWRSRPCLLWSTEDRGWNVICPHCRGVLYNSVYHYKTGWFTTAPERPCFTKLREHMCPDPCESIDCNHCGRDLLFYELQIMDHKRWFGVNRPIPIYHLRVEWYNFNAEDVVKYPTLLICHDRSIDRLHDKLGSPICAISYDSMRNVSFIQ